MKDIKKRLSVNPEVSIKAVENAELEAEKNGRTVRDQIIWDLKVLLDSRHIIDDTEKNKEVFLTLPVYYYSILAHLAGRNKRSTKQQAAFYIEEIYK